MDIRVTKTKTAVMSAFFELRKTLPLEKIKVTDLCKNARINKTTFYNYYDDIYDLNDELEREVFSRFQKEFKVCGCLFTDPETFVKGIPEAIRTQWQLIFPLYHDRPDVFFLRLEKDMKEYYTKNHPDNISDVRAAFIISGTVSILEDMKEDRVFNDTAIAEIISAVKDLMK